MVAVHVVRLDVQQDDLGLGVGQPAADVLLDLVDAPPRVAFVAGPFGVPDGAEEPRLVRGLGEPAGQQGPVDVGVQRQ
ncbi:hypothetical protein [Streptomyces sp. NPDC085479]|uniref:hypothetical protein n=1 Tax=Streptomyces sp. NPDC085479 TaxID=3365726 RepID=UPI0037D6B193